MAKYRVMVAKYGYAEVGAASEEEALETTKKMNDSDFDWSKPGEEQVVEEIDGSEL